jgi:pantoate--beta-alanine ligase
MRVVTTRAELAAVRREHDSAAELALVPTMGALHRGHRELVRRADPRRSTVYVSIFVNPLQFGPAEDFGRYPRNLDDDLAICADEGVDTVFAPATEEMYGAGTPGVTVAAGPLGERLEGTTRPGHFDGVLTVVAKLFHLVLPDVAYFGQKDAQQLAMVKAMVRDLSFPVEVVGVPTVRDDDGLALSSRNAYLDPAQRRQATSISRALNAGRAAEPHGAQAVHEAARRVLDAAPEGRVDYLALVDADTFGDVDAMTSRGLLLVAAWVGGTRLIDNVTLDLAAAGGATRHVLGGDVTAR